MAAGKTAGEMRLVPLLATKFGDSRKIAIFVVRIYGHDAERIHSRYRQGCPPFFGKALFVRHF